VFEEVYKNAPESERDAVKHLIQQGDTDAVEQWIAIQQRNTTVNIATLNMRDLRQLAAKLGIASYNLLPKASLLSAIKNIQGKQNGG
jgi:phage terminase small subunit